MNTEDKFYFGKTGQPERFQNAPWLPEINHMLRDLGRERKNIQIWISGSNSVTVSASHIGTSYRVMARALSAYRISNYLKDSVPGAVQTSEEKHDYPKKGMWTVFYKVSNLPKELIAYLKNWGIGTTPQAFSGFTGASAVAYSRPGQPERFGVDKDMMGTNKRIIRARGHEFLAEDEGNRTRISIKIDGVWEHATTVNTDNQTATEWIEANAKPGHPSRWLPSAFSRPGQPERFGLEDACWEGYEPVGTKQKDGRTVPNCVPKDENAEPEEFGVQDPAKELVRVRIGSSTVSAQEFREYAKRFVPGVSQNDFLPDMIQKVNAALQRRGDSIRAEIVTKAQGFSRPGQPDKFDASSLDRGNFAEASQSPMLGKLLAAKVMPEGGWRAVQVGSDTLVISFEDADLASDFGRRVATKGYNATSPVQAIGRYWNVEVKNGK